MDFLVYSNRSVLFYDAYPAVMFEKVDNCCPVFWCSPMKSLCPCINNPE